MPLRSAGGAECGCDSPPNSVKSEASRSWSSVHRNCGLSRCLPMSLNNARSSSFSRMAPPPRLCPRRWCWCGVHVMLRSIVATTTSSCSCHSPRLQSLRVLLPPHWNTIQPSATHNLKNPAAAAARHNVDKSSAFAAISSPWLPTPQFPHIGDACH